MLIQTFKKILTYKLIGNIELPLNEEGNDDNDILALLFYEASLEILMECENSVNTFDLDTVGLNVLRRNECAIITMPELADFNDESLVLPLDEILCFASIYLVASYISTADKSGDFRESSRHFISSHVKENDKCMEDE